MNYTPNIPSTLAFLALSALLVLPVAGCEKKSDAPAPAEAAAAPAGAAAKADAPKATPKALTDEGKAGLAAGDLADGTADKVVHKCASCMLKMDGSADHTASIGGYEVHACSAECKERMESDPESVFAPLAK